jgi:cobalt-zinc-cadmium efflux system outer membrane protein
MSSSLLVSLRRGWCLVAVALSSGAVLRAADSSGSFSVTVSAPLTLSLGEALRRAAERNPALLARQYETRAAEATVEQAGLRPNPTLEVSVENVAGTGAWQGVRGLEATVQASQAIERGGKHSRRVALAERDREATTRDAAVTRAEVLAETALRFVEALATQEARRLAEEPRRLAEETVVAIEVRVRAGAVSPAEAARARANLARAEADVARAEASARTAQMRLAAAWGGPSEETFSIAGRVHLPESLPAGVPSDVWLPRHPKVQWHESMISSRRAALELEQAHAVQDLSVGGGLRFLREGSDAALVAAVSIPLPVRNRNQGTIRAARERLAGAEQAARATQSELVADFHVAWHDLTVAHAAASRLKRDVLPPTQSAAQSVRHAFAQGQLPLVDVLEAQRALIAVQREILDVEVAYVRALARIDALTDPDFPSVTSLLSQP